MQLLSAKIFVIVCWLSYISCNLQSPVLTPPIAQASNSLGDCKACKVLVDSIKKGLKRTQRGKFDGGDAAWEEEKLKSYKNSEIRLVEVQEGLCKELKKNEAQCHTIAEKAEEFIEDWWFNKQDTHDLYDFLCIHKLQYCCPAGHYGKYCEPCNRESTQICNGNGKCKGDGTRKGNGQCSCDAGYTGSQCDKCASTYYESYKDDNKMLCSKCHKSCVGDCSNGGTKGCLVCAPGWSMDAELGCTDINECEDEKICEENTFCVNEDGSHSCLACDKSCNGCHGDGPDLCTSCATGYSKKGELCIADREHEDSHDHLTNTRYSTYVGLVIATLILLPKSTTLGTAVGTMVVAYIVSAEYYCMLNGHSHGLVDLKKFDLMRFFRT